MSFQVPGPGCKSQRVKSPVCTVGEPKWTPEHIFVTAGNRTRIHTACNLSLCRPNFHENQHKNVRFLLRMPWTQVRAIIKPLRV